MVEHVLGKDGVTGSIPVSSLIHIYARINYLRMYWLQEPQLYDNQEQEIAPREAGFKEVL